jgi:hypothetical protein
MGRVVHQPKVGAARWTGLRHQLPRLAIPGPRLCQQTLVVVPATEQHRLTARGVIRERHVIAWPRRLRLDQAPLVAIPFPGLRDAVVAVQRQAAVSDQDPACRIEGGAGDHHRFRTIPIQQLPAPSIPRPELLRLRTRDLVDAVRQDHPGKGCVEEHGRLGAGWRSLARSRSRRCGCWCWQDRCRRRPAAARAQADPQGEQQAEARPHSTIGYLTDGFGG